MSAWCRRPGALALLLALGLVLVAAGSTASAKSSRQLKFELPPSHGYRVQVDARGETASLTATRAKVGARTGSLSSYIARRKSGDGAIQATFGDLGAIAMRFRPAGAVTYSKPEKGCRGPDRFTIHHGVFVGSLRFRGEDGYVSVKASRVKGTSISPLALHCTGRARAQSAAARQPTFAFKAGFRAGLLAEFFFAISERPAPPRFIASIEQTEGTLAIHRLAVAIGPQRAFVTDDTLSFASLAPAAPFSGTGSLTRDPFGVRLWGGSLNVSFPGAPDVPLTGPLFKTRLSRSFG